MEKFTKTELIEEVARLTNLSKNRAKTVIGVIEDILTREIEKNKKVYCFLGHCYATLYTRKAYFLPRKNQRVEGKIEYVKIGFKPRADIKRKLKNFLKSS